MRAMWTNDLGPFISTVGWKCATALPDDTMAFSNNILFVCIPAREDTGVMTQDSQCPP